MRDLVHLDYSILSVPEITAHILDYTPNGCILETLRMLISLCKQVHHDIIRQPIYIRNMLKERKEIKCESISDLECLANFIGWKHQKRDGKLTLSRLRGLRERHVSLINSFEYVEFEDFDIDPRMLLSIINPHDCDIQKLHFNNCTCFSSHMAMRLVRISSNLKCLSFSNCFQGDHNPFLRIIPFIHVGSIQCTKLIFNSPISNEDGKLAKIIAPSLKSIKFLNQKEGFKNPSYALGIESVSIPTLGELSSEPFTTLKVDKFIGKVKQPVPSVKNLVIRDFEYELKEKENFLQQKMKKIVLCFPNCNELTISDNCYKLLHNSSKGELKAMPPNNITHVRLMYSQEYQPFVCGSLVYAMEYLFPNAKISLNLINPKKPRKFPMFDDFSIKSEEAATCLKNQVFNSIESLSNNPEYSSELIHHFKSEFCYSTLNSPPENRNSNRERFIKLVDDINRVDSFKLTKTQIFDNFSNTIEIYGAFQEDDLHHKANDLLKIALDCLSELSPNSSLEEDKSGKYLFELQQLVQEMKDKIEKMNLPKNILQNRNEWYSNEIIECYNIVE